MSSIITPEAILSYPRLFEPEVGPSGGDPKYSCCLVFPAGSDLKELKKAAIEAAQEKWGEKAVPGIRSGKLRMPFRDDPEDVADKGYPEGSTFMNVRTKKAPGVVSIFPDPNNDGKPMPITDEDEVYAGCYVRASLRAFAYDTQGNRGVSFALNNVQKLRDGERIDGRRAAVDEFEADENAAADLSDLTDGDDRGIEREPLPSEQSDDDLSDLLG